MGASVAVRKSNGPEHRLKSRSARAQKAQKLLLRQYSCGRGTAPRLAAPRAQGKFQHSPRAREVFYFPPATMTRPERTLIGTASEEGSAPRAPEIRGG